MTAAVVQRRSAVQARRDRAEVEEVFRRSYPATDDAFRSAAAFLHRFDHYTANPHFDMVVAIEDGRWIGQAWGWPLAAGTAWWDGLADEPEPDFSREDGRRTFAVSEIMVDRDRTGRGVAHLLHDSLLGARSEERATLLVDPRNIRARERYLRWGWRAVSRLTPAWDGAPTFDVLVRVVANGADPPVSAS